MLQLLDDFLRVSIGKIYISVIIMKISNITQLIIMA